MLKNSFYYIGLKFLVSLLEFIRVYYYYSLSEFHECIPQQPCCKGVNLNRFLKKCPCYYVLIIVSSQHVLDMHDVQKVELVCLYICCHLSVFLNNSDMRYHMNNTLETPFCRGAFKCWGYMFFSYNTISSRFPKIIKFASFASLLCKSLRIQFCPSNKSVSISWM